VPHLFFTEVQDNDLIKRKYLYQQMEIQDDQNSHLTKNTKIRRDFLLKPGLNSKNPNIYIMQKTFEKSKVFAVYTLKNYS